MAGRPSRRSANRGRRVLRPKAEVLDDAALVPAERRIEPPPDRFTHELVRPQPYYFGAKREVPAGRLAAGARVVLTAYDGGDFCSVVDARGLTVETAYAGLRRLEDAAGS